MWCNSSDAPLHDRVSQPHHKIVRIPPGESVVLNSAERAPYLLLIEVLDDDLDFDPQKRSNKDLLRKIVTKDTAQPQRGSTLSAVVPRRSDSSTAAYDGSHTPGALQPSSVSVVPPTPINPMQDMQPTDANSDEEVDLVEQLYGESHSRQIDIAESFVLPPKPKNRELDIMTWSRSNSLPPTPQPDSTAPIFQTHQRSTSSHDAVQASPPLDASQLITMDDYSERMRMAAVMLAQLNVNQAPSVQLSSNVGATSSPRPDAAKSWLPESSWLGIGSSSAADNAKAQPAGPLHPSLRSGNSGSMRLLATDAAAIRDRIMKEMNALEEERMARMREYREGDKAISLAGGDSSTTVEDEGIIRRELNKADPSAVVFSESWATKKSRIRHNSPYGHLVNWNCVSVIVKTGDLRQEQLATQLIREFASIWNDENCPCYARYFRILITGSSSGLVETITDTVSIHSIKKSEYARRLATGRLGHVSLLDHFKNTYGDVSSVKFARAQRNFVKSLAGYSVITYLLQIKDRHNGNILIDRDGNLIHIDFGFMLSNSPGNIGFEAAPFKFSSEYIEVLGGVDSPAFLEFRKLFHEGFIAARKHCDRIITMVELMQKDSSMACFAAFGDQTAAQLRDRFQPSLTHSLIGEYIDRLIDSSLNSNWTRLYDSFQYYSQGVL